MIGKLRKAMLLCAAIALPVTAQTPQTPAAAAPTSAAQRHNPPADGVALAEALRLVDIWLDSVQVYKRLPSLTAAVVQGDRIVWAGAYGHIDAARTIPTTPSTIYSICSISKLFTAIALMREWEAGKVRLDDPVTTYLPWAKLAASGEDSVPVTVRGILTHSAGLPRESAHPYWTGPDFPFPTTDEIKATIGGQAPLYPASRWFQYSNLGLTLAGDIAAATGGEAYDAYVQRHILGPLGLKDTRPTFRGDELGKRMAVGWGALKRDGTRDLLKPFDTRGIAPAAGFTSTVEDLGRFAIWQFRLLRTGTPEVLKASTLREMQRVQYTDPDFRTTWGLGFAVRRQGDRTFVGHGGDCPGYRTTLQLLPETETAVTAMATGAENPAPQVAQIFQLLAKRQGHSFKAPAPASVDLAPFTGVYSSQPWGSEFVLVPWAGGLAMLSLPSETPADDIAFLKPRGGDVFRPVRASGGEMDEVRFVRDARGRVTGLSRFGNISKKTRDLPAFQMR
ncbi:serine hydrolase domain-containing protein [Sphingomonas sp.]|uniref:serine hydrolase domain-containing protein n=1 Tax=Sphingomonas sp. TaxID=28214 RepID=UPI002DD652B9|nr:serine hydrolase domain-containing protein [Sphingomonas sp.]